MSADRLHPLHGEGLPTTDRIPDDVFASAVSSTRMSMVVADPNRPDCPVVFCNQAFLDLTGYTETEVMGRNCRFLQGRDTDPDTARRIGEALRAREDVTRRSSTTARTARTSGTRCRSTPSSM